MARNLYMRLEAVADTEWSRAERARGAVFLRSWDSAACTEVLHSAALGWSGWRSHDAGGAAQDAG